MWICFEAASRRAVDTLALDNNVYRSLQLAGTESYQRGCMETVYFKYVDKKTFYELLFVQSVTEWIT